MKLTILDQALYTKLYTDIAEFRSSFGLPIEDIMSMDEQSDLLHSSLAIEELTELAEATDRIDQADAIIDLAYVLMGRAVQMGYEFKHAGMISYMIDVLLNVANNLNIDFIACWNEIHSSNMSKLCLTEDSYDRTVIMYANKGVVVSKKVINGYIAVVCAKDVMLGTKLIRKGKTLKAIDYRPANLKSVYALKPEMV